MTIREGASIGARAVCVAPVTIGAWATVAAGAVVTKDVPDFALVVGRPRPAHRLGRQGRVTRSSAMATGGGCPVTSHEICRGRRSPERGNNE